MNVDARRYKYWSHNLDFVLRNVLRNLLKRIRYESAAERLSVHLASGDSCQYRSLMRDVPCRSSMAQWSKDFLTSTLYNLFRLRRSRHYIIHLRCLYNIIPLRKTRKTIPKPPNYYQKWGSYEWLSKTRVVFWISFTFLFENVPIISDVRGTHH